jgi:Tfp pilus assembly PilM family ATPase
MKDVLTVIEFSSQSVKIAQTGISQKRLIFNMIAKDGIPDSEDEFVKEIDRAIKANSLKIDNLIVSLDRSLVTIRAIRLPSTDEKEIEDMSKWQAAKLLPYKIDEMSICHQTIKVDESGLSHVVLAIVPKNIIRKFTNICETLRLQTKIITISSEGLLHWAVGIQSINTDTVLLLVDIDKNKAELAVVYRDKFIFSRSFSLPQSQSDMQSRKRIVDEAKLSIDAYRKQEASQQISKIVLTGSNNQIADMTALFEQEFNLPTEFIGHLRNLYSKYAANTPKTNDDFSFASVCGSALNSRLLKINLCPQEIKDRMLYLEKKKELLKTLTLGFFAVLFISIILGLNFYNKRKIISILNSQIDKINPAASEIQDIKNKIAVINSQSNSEGSCMEILREIHKITPPEIYLNTFLFEEGKMLTIKGTAPTMSLVFNFVPILDKSSFFESVQVRYATQRKMQTEELTDFEITCKLSG